MYIVVLTDKLNSLICAIYFSSLKKCVSVQMIRRIIVVFSLLLITQYLSAQSCQDNNIGFNSDTSLNSLAVCAGTTGVIALGDDPSGAEVFSWEVATSLSGPFTTVADDPGNDDEYSISTFYLNSPGTYYFIRTISGSASCDGSSDTITLVVNPVPTLSSISQLAAVCEGNAAQINLFGLLPSSTCDITYNINGGVAQTVNNITADAGGEATFTTIPLSFADNSTLLEITSVTITSSSPQCAQVFTVSTTLSVNSIPAAPAVSANSPLCEGSNLNLSTALVTGASYNWTGPNSFVSSLQNPSVNNISLADAGNYLLNITVNGCTSGNGSVNVTVSQTPTVANAGADQTGALTCGLTSVTLSANTPVVGTGTWSIVTGTGGGFSDVNNPSAVFTGVAGDSYTLRWTISNAPCAASSDDVDIVFNQSPATANAGADQTGALTCGLTSVTLAANTPAVGTGTWSIVTGTGGSFSDVNNPAATFIGVAGNSYTLSWTINNAPCASSSDDVDITFNQPPTTANAGPDQTGAATCGLTSVTLAANTVLVGTGTWSIVTGTGGSFSDVNNPAAVFTGTAGNTYTLRWTISNAPCTSSSDDVVITFNAAPTASNAGPDQTSAATCNITTVALAANNPLVGTGLWSIVSGTGGSFGSNASPVSSFTGTAGNTYTLRWTITNGLCVSTDDVVITFNRTPSTSNAGPDQTGVGTCGLTTVTLNANAPAVGTGSWAIVSGTGGSFANPAQRNTTFTGTPGAPGYTLRWTISNAPCASSFDDVNIIFNIAPAANAGTDQSVCATTATLAGNTPAAGTGTWTLVSGTGSITAVNNPSSGVTGLGVGANTFRWTNTNAPCAASFDDVVITRFATPTVANAGPNQSICGTTATLAGNNPATGTGAWSIISGTGGSVTNPASFNSLFTGVVGTSYTLRWTISNGSCTPSTDDVIITFNQPPTTANAGPDQTSAATCGLTSVTLGANTTVVGTGAWSIISGTGGTITTLSNPASNFSGTAGNTYTLRWTITNAGCTSTDDVVITFNRNPTASNAGVNQTICSNASATLNANNPAVGTGSWSVLSGPSTSSAQFGNTTVRNTTFTPAGGAGTYVLTWTISNSPCASSSSNVTITVNPAPSVAAISGANSVCDGSTITLTDATPGGTWSSSNTGIATVNASGLVTGVSPGTATITYTVTSGGCTAAVTKSITVNAVPSPVISFYDGGLIDTYSTSACGIISYGGQNDLDILSGNPGGSATLQWQVSFDNGVTWSNAPGPTATATQYVLDPLYTSFETVPGTYLFRLLITNNGCVGVSNTNTLTITGISDLTGGAVAANQSFCGSGNPALLTSTSLPTGGGGSGTYSYQWQSSTDNVNFTNIGGATATTYDPPVISQTTYYRRVVVSGGCRAFSNTITVFVNAAVPATPGSITGNISVCASSSQTYSITAVAGAVSYNWTLPAGWTGSSTTNSITATAGANSGNISVTATNACGTSAANSISVTVTALPSTANAGADQNNCNSANFTLAGNTPVNGTGAWSIVSGTATITSPSSATSTVTGVPAGSSATLRWTISNGPCTASTDDVVLTNKALPTTADAGTDQTGATTCGLTTVTLAANTPAVGTGSWSIVSGTGGSFGNASSPASTFTGTAGNTYTLRWTISNSPCTASADDVIITFNRNPTTANAGPDQTGSATCGLTTVTLAANAPAVGTGSWSIISGTGGSFGNASSPTSAFTGTAGNSYTLRWTIANSPCAASTDDVIITFNISPSAANAGADQTGAATCGLTAVTLSANTPVIGTGAWSIVSGTGGSFVSTSNPSTTFNGTAGNAYTLRWTITNGVCVSTDDVLVTFNRNPTASNAGTDIANCNSGSFTMNANNPTVGTGAWTLISGTATITTPASRTTGITGVPVGTSATLRWTISNSPCTASADDVIVTNVAPATTANAGADQTNCNNGSFTLAGNTPVNGTGAWSIISGTGTITTPSSPVSTVTGVPAGTSITLRWTISNSPCAASTDDVILTNNPAPAVTGAIICQGGSGTVSSSTSCPSGGSGTAGPNFPASGTTGGSGDAWSNPGRVNANENSYTTSFIGGGNSSQILSATNFGFSIPAGAVINGIQVSIGRFASQTNSLRDNSVRLIIGGSVTGNNNGATGTNWPNAEAVANYGTTSDLWGTAITAAQVNATNFGIALVVNNIAGGNRTASVDYITVTVSYTIPGVINWYTVSSGGTSIGSGSPFNPVGVAGSGLPNTNTPGTTTYYAECSTIAGCRTATTFVINPTATLSAAALAAPICEGVAAQINLSGLVASSTATINYTINGIAQTPVAGVTANASGNASFNTGILTAANNGQTLQVTGITITSVSPSCTQSFTANTTLQVKSTGTWLGNNSNWYDPLNWCGGVPTGTVDALFPGSLSNYPLLNTGTGTVKNITIQNTAMVTVSNARLQVAGTISNSGSFNVSAGQLELNGSGTAQNISGAMLHLRSVGGLIISNSSGVNVSGAAGDTLNVLDSIAFGNVNNTVLNTGNNITLVSRSAKTARIADITNGGINSGNSFTGKMMIERYIPPRRSWRLLTVPVAAAGAPTFNASWQEGVVNPDYVYANNNDPHPGFGMHISGSSPALGFDPTPQNNPSIKQYDPSTGNWNGIPNTLSAKVADSTGYMVFVRGNRSTQLFMNTAAATSSTVLRASGNVKINNQVISVPGGASGYTIVGNPFASAIDLRKLAVSGGVNGVNYAVWDPALTGINGVGAYQYLTRSGGPGTDYLVFPGNSGLGGGSYGAAFSVNNIIESGQAFMVQNSGTGTVAINENAKLATSSSSVFRPAAPSDITSFTNGYISTMLLYHPGGQGSPEELLDGALLMYDDGFSDDVNLDDARKMLNFSSENFGIDHAGNWLAIDKRRTIAAADTIFFRARSYRVRDYELHIKTANMNKPGLMGFLEDQYLHKLIPLDLNGSTEYAFSVSLDSGAWHPQRFRIVFKAMSALPVNFVSVHARQNKDVVNVEWKVEQQSGISHYVVEKSADGLHFSQIYQTAAVAAVQYSYRFADQSPVPAFNYYRIRSVGRDGKEQLSAVVKVLFSGPASQVTLYPNPVTDQILHLYFQALPAGTYQLNVRNSAGQLLQSSALVHNATTVLHVLTLDKKIPQGAYSVEIISPGEEKQVIQFIKTQ